MDYSKSIETLIWWHDEPNSSTLWTENDGFNVTLTNWEETSLAKNVEKLLKNINCIQTVCDLEESARQSAIRWKFLESELWNLNYEHEQSCNEPVTLYKSRMKRFDLNQIWSTIIRECAIRKRKELEEKKCF